MNLKKGIVAVAGMALVASPHAAAGQDTGPLELEPTSDWVADFADESCALRRAFGNGEQTVSLELKQFAPGNWMQVSVASPTLDLQVREPRFYFQPNDKADETSLYRSVATSDGGKGVLVSASLMTERDRATDRASGDLYLWPAPDRDRREREVTGFVLAGAFRKDVLLRTGSMHAPMKVMRNCLDDLLSRWGLDPEAHGSMSRKVNLDGDQALWRRLGRVVTAGGRNGMALARLLIDENGRLAECRMLEGPTQRADEFCEAVREEAKFAPAADRESRPMKSYYMLEFAAVLRPEF